MNKAIGINHHGIRCIIKNGDITPKYDIDSPTMLIGISIESFIVPRSVKRVIATIAKTLVN
jgi:hypothetical protein